VAFWEGMALFSTIFEQDSMDIKEVLKGFQYRVLDII
jgi:hypothetical protein